MNFDEPQPIETAPSDFSRFLAYFKASDRWVICSRQGKYTLYYDGDLIGIENFSHWLPMPPRPAETPKTEPTSDFFSVAKDIIKTSL